MHCGAGDSVIVIVTVTKTGTVVSVTVPGDNCRGGVVMVVVSDSGMATLVKCRWSSHFTLTHKHPLSHNRRKSKRLSAEMRHSRHEKLQTLRKSIPFPVHSVNRALGSFEFVNRPKRPNLRTKMKPTRDSQQPSNSRKRETNLHGQSRISGELPSRIQIHVMSRFAED